MKRVLSVILILVIAFSAIPTGLAFATTKESGTIGDCTWEFDGTTLTISGEGSMDIDWDDDELWDSEKVKSVVIENGVTSIGDSAFSNCENLTSITIPNSVTDIGEEAFCYCENLTSITIPNSVTSIGQGAFFYCTNLESIEIPNSVKYIESSTFGGCTNLASIEIPNSVIYIETLAFACCANLASIEIPNSVTDIETFAFDGCTNLASIEIPNSVTNIGMGAFQNCTDLASITVEEGNPEYHSNGNCLIETDTKTLVSGCKNSVIPSDGSVTSIAEYAFKGCESLESITIPNSVTRIGILAFGYSGVYNSDNYKNGILYIDNCLIEVVSDEEHENYNVEPDTRLIADFAFSNCEGLESIEIPNSVTSIGKGVFEYCCDLASITVEEGNPEYHSNGNCLIETDTKTLVSGCKNSVIPSDGSVTSIAEYAFKGCESLESITIPNSVTRIGDSAFSCCYGLTSIEIPNSVTSIGDSAFSCCYGLTSITIPNSVTDIGEDAFYDVAEDFVIYGEKGSYAEMYANDYDIPFVAIGSHIHKPGKTVVTKATASKDGKIAKICDTCKKTISTTTIYKASNLKLSTANYTYNGKVKTPAVTVKNSKGKTLKKNTDYTVSYSKGRKNVGKYAVTVKFKGNYSGTKTLYFTINPKGTKLSSVKSSKTKTATVKWKAQKTQTSGYQIRYSTKSNFKSSKILTVSKNSTVSKTIAKLTKKKTYYFSVRTYKTVGKTKFCSSWSGSKKVKIK